MSENLAGGLRDHLCQNHQGFAEVAAGLWSRAEEIHNRQNRPDSNENGRKHVERVEQNIWRLLTETTDGDTKQNLEKFKPYELFLLSCAACCHDFDKALRSALPAGFVHGEGSGDFVEKNYEKLGLSRPRASMVAQVVSLHDRKTGEFQEGLQRLKTNHATESGPVNLRRLAVLLKAADILHTDNSRVPTLAVDHNELEGLDRDKYLARYCIDGWQADGTRIVVQAEPRDVEQALALSKCYEYMKEQEWTAVADALQQYGFPHDLRLENLGIRDSTDVLQLVAVRPDELDDALGRLSRLTVIGNRYVDFGTEHLGGVPGALSRIYVAPADVGKTRAAVEWVRKVTAAQPEAWVVLLSKSGTIPNDAKRILLDRAAYERNNDPLPRRAILFLDDLPDQLPPERPEMSASDAVRELFRWFQNYPGFQERRLVGTIRRESLHAKPGWPDVLPSLGEELELLTLSPPDDAKRRELWQGMSSGAIFQSNDRQPFSVQIDPPFIDAVAQRSTNAEAVAFFIHSTAAKKTTRLQTADADDFLDSAVKTWLSETWPAVLQAYGPTARVFHTLARFLEAGLRPDSGFIGNLPAAWEFHEAFGPDLCAELSCCGEDYLDILQRMIRDGHAMGEPGQWIRPAWDFLLQGKLPGVERPLPSFQWFAQRVDRLSPTGRQAIATHLSAANVEVVCLKADDAWHFGWAHGRSLLAESETDDQRCRMFRDEEIVCYRKTVEANPKHGQAWYNLGVTVSQETEREEDPEKRRSLRNEEVVCYRKAVEANPKHGQAWYNLGVRLCQEAGREEDAKRRTLGDEGVTCYREAVKANPKHDRAWTNLGVRLGQEAEREEDPEKRRTLWDEAVACCRKAVEANPKNSVGWNNLSSQLSDSWRETGRQESLAEALEAARGAVALGEKHYNLACALALTGSTDEAIDELAGCFERGEIERAHVEKDLDWDGLREQPRFRALMGLDAAD
ncbi:MAG: hypothetical protein V3R99_10175 [Thermoguttaceae bacterium]